MSNIKIITSNFLSPKSNVWFENVGFKCESVKSPGLFKTISCKEIKTLTYKKPGHHSKASGVYGLFSAVKNIASVAKSIKTGQQIEFNVHFKDGKYLVGVTNMDDYFKIQNAWLEVK